LINIEEMKENMDKIRLTQFSNYVEDLCLDRLKKTFGTFNASKISELNNLQYNNPEYKTLYKNVPLLIKKNPKVFDMCFLNGTRLNIVEAKSGFSELSFKQIHFLKKLKDIECDFWVFHLTDIDSKAIMTQINEYIDSNQLRNYIRWQAHPQLKPIPDSEKNNEFTDYTFDELLSNTLRQIKHYDYKIRYYKSYKKTSKNQLKHLIQVRKKGREEEYMECYNEKFYSSYPNISDEELERFDLAMTKLGQKIKNGDK
jgi:hypothetical protein